MRIRPYAPMVSVGVLAILGCQGSELHITLIDGCPEEAGFSFKEAADYMQVVAFENKCPRDAELQAGIVEGAVAQKVADADAPPALGKLKPGRYGFAVLLRDRSCGVVGFGCTDQEGEGVDTRKVGRVDIRVGAFGNSDFCEPFSGGGCSEGQSCDEGRCSGDSAVGGGPTIGGGSPSGTLGGVSGAGSVRVGGGGGA